MIKNEFKNNLYKQFIHIVYKRKLEMNLFIMKYAIFRKSTSINNFSNIIKTLHNLMTLSKIKMSVIFS